MRRAAAVVAFLTVFAGLAGPTHAVTQTRGFNGHASGQASFVPTASTACVNPPMQTRSTGSGATSPMGPVTMSALHCSGNHIDGTMTLTGKRGTVTLHYVGDCTPYVPGLARVECSTAVTVTGGTGQYTGATGTGHMHAVVLPQADFTVPWPATWTWKGRISY